MPGGVPLNWPELELVEPEEPDEEVPEDDVPDDEEDEPEPREPDPEEPWPWEPPPWLAKGSWYWLSPAPCASAVAGRAMVSPAARTARGFARIAATL
jgi:hypothetical protein